MKIFIVVLIFCLINQNSSRQMRTLETDSESNVSKILNQVLRNYDKDVRPTDNVGSPSKIKVDIYVRSMSRISEIDSEYTFNCYFRQRWKDERLSFDYGPNMIIVNIKLLEKIWQPYTYFANSNMAYIHKVPSSNRFFRINRDGTVLYSMRLTITSKCPMDLKNFPADLQKCPLFISSFVYSVNEVEYIWNKSIKENKAINVAKDMQMSQFDLLGTEEYSTNTILNRINQSCLVGIFKFKRQLNYFFIQIYLPCILVVLVSWIGFYIEREDAVDRVSLGALSILTMVYLIMECKSDLPKVKYFTALDIYLVVCFIFIVSSIIEYGVVHLQIEQLDEQDTLTVYRYLSLNRRGIKNFKKSLKEIEKGACLITNQPKSTNESFNTNEDSEERFKLLSLLNKEKLRAKVLSIMKSEPNLGKYSRISRIDFYSRIFYPILFTLFNLFYWKYFLNIRDINE